MGRGNPRSQVKEALLVLRLVLPETVRSFWRDRGMESAATLAFHGVLSLMPLMLLFLIVASRLMLSSEVALAELRVFLEGVFPRSAEAVLADVQALSEQGVWGILGVVLLLWSVTPFAAVLHSAFTRILGSSQSVHFLRAKLRDAATVLSVLLVVALLISVRAAYAAAEEALLHAIPLLRPLVGQGVPWVMTVGAIALLYRVFSPVRVGPAPLLAGALVAAALLFVMRPAFALMLRFNPEYGFAFGSMKAIFLSMLWAYYLAAVFLLGGELMANLHHKDALLLRDLLARSGAASGIAEPLLERFTTEHGQDAVLFREGDLGQVMYYVVAGSVLIRRGEKTLATLGPGSYFGEMSMLTRAPRTATAIAAAGGTRLVAISEENFTAILRENPAIARALLVKMAERLNATNERLAAAQEP